MIGPRSGSRDNVPSFMRDALKEKANSVVFWSQADPSLPLQRSNFCRLLGPLPFLPCFYPHLLFLCTPICCFSYYEKSKYLATSVAVTATSVEIVTEPHCCGHKQVKVQSIPLQSILDVYIYKENHPMQMCCQPDTGYAQIRDGTVVIGKNSGGSSGGPTIDGHRDIATLKQKILEAKERLTSTAQAPVYVGTVVNSNVSSLNTGQYGGYETQGTVVSSNVSSLNTGQYGGYEMSYPQYHGSLR